MRISDWSSDVCLPILEVAKFGYPGIPATAGIQSPPRAVLGSGLPLSRENVRLFPLGDLLHRPPGLHARQARLDQRVGAARLGIADLAQQPVLARFLAARLQPDQQPFALHPLAIEDEVEMSLFQILLRLALDKIGRASWRERGCQYG